MKRMVVGISIWVGSAKVIGMSALWCGCLGGVWVMWDMGYGICAMVGWLGGGGGGLW